MRNGAIFSGILHVLVLLIAWFGIPMLPERELEPDHPIIVEVMTIADKTNPPPGPPEQAKAAEQPKPEPPKPEPPKPEPPKPEPPKPPPPAPPPPTPPPPPPPPPAPPPPPTPPPPAPPKPPEPDAVPEPIPKPTPKPKPPEETPPVPQTSTLDKVQPPKKPPPPQDDFLSVLKSVEKFKQPPTPRTEQKPAPQATPAAAAPRGAGRNNPDQPLTMSEMDAIRRQLEACWSPPAGALNARDLRIEVAVNMNPDGNVRDYHLTDVSQGKMGDPFYRAAAESALRALRNPRCVPLKLPPDKYETWKSFTVMFDPKEMLQ